MNRKMHIVSLVLSLSVCSVDTSLSKTPIGHSSKNQDHINTPTKKKRVLIFTSAGGGGHMSASNAIKEYLRSDYEIKVVNLIDKVLMPIDPVRKITFNKYTSEDSYNYCLKNGWISFLNTTIPWGTWTSNMKHKATEFLIDQYIEQLKIKPDIVISVIPVFNGSLLAVAQKYKIPALIVTADLDGINYINGITKPIYDRFYYCIPFDDKDIRKRIKPARIRHSQIKVSGFPVRPDFIGKKNLLAIKKEFKIALNKPVVMLLMGAAGSNSTYKYLKAMTNTNLSMHVIVCLGRNEQLRARIEELVLPQTITLSIVGFTDQISDLMAVSNVLITKPGPTTMCEAVQMKLPMIIDGTKNILYWESMNLKFIKKQKFGDVLTSYSHLEKILSKYILDQTYASSIKRRMKKFNKESFAHNIQEFVAELLDKPTLSRANS